MGVEVDTGVKGSRETLSVSPHQYSPHPPSFQPPSSLGPLACEETEPGPWKGTPEGGRSARGNLSGLGRGWSTVPTEPASPSFFLLS